MLNKPPKLKAIVKTNMKTVVNVKPTSEAMIELMTLLLLHSLAEQAKAKAFEEKSSTIRGHHLKAVAKEVLKKTRG